MSAPVIAQHHQCLTGSAIFSPNLTSSCGRRRTTNLCVRMSFKEDGPSLAVVGVTGAVGQEFLGVISDLDFPYRSFKMLASKFSAGKRITFEDKEYVIEELRHDSFDGVDIALLSAGGSISKEFGPIAIDHGSVVIDNNSAFRMEENVPLVIPEVNPDAISHIKLGSGKGALIANPNCSTIMCLIAATPLHRHAKVIRMVVRTYQAASSADAAAMQELELQTREYALNLFSHNAPGSQNGYNEEEMQLVKETRKIWNDSNVKVTANCIRVPVMCAHAENISFQFENPLDEYALNLFSHNAPGCQNGYNEEEMQLVKETRKIWNDSNVKVTATSMRVPVMRAHAESINLQFENPLYEDTARDILNKAAGVVIIDDRASNRFPTPLEVSNKDDVAVGRIRQDLSQDGNHGLDMFACGDQICKGAALNAIQIAELLL